MMATRRRLEVAAKKRERAGLPRSRPYARHERMKALQADQDRRDGKRSKKVKVTI